MEYKLIVAATERGGIGLKGNLPWRLPQDMAYFKRVTSQCEAEGKHNAVIMGRKTWSSIPERFRPLAGRHNVVISGNPKIREEASIGDDVLVATSFQDALRLLVEQRMSTLGDVYVIGGASIYAEALRSKLCKEILLTTVRKEFECDTYFPDVTSLGFAKSHSVEAHVQDGIAIDMAVYTQRNEAEAVQSIAIAPPMIPSDASAPAAHPEMQYLHLIRQIIESGDRRGDRHHENKGNGTQEFYDISDLVQRRETFRAQGDFDSADRIRDDLTARGVKLLDKYHKWFHKEKDMGARIPKVGKDDSNYNPNRREERDERE